MTRQRYHITGYVRCGEMPMYLIFYSDRRGYGEHSVMLCTHRRLRALLRQKKGFDSPADYGKVVYRGREGAPYPTMDILLKARYGFDLSHANIMAGEAVF